MISSHQIQLFKTVDGEVQLNVALQGETVWLTQAQMCELFDKNKRTVSEHIRNIFKEDELIEESVVRKFRTTASDGKSYTVNHYNLDVDISLGYQVKSQRGIECEQVVTPLSNTLANQHFILLKD